MKSTSLVGEMYRLLQVAIYLQQRLYPQLC
jgi:hypothetical protein